MGSTVRALQRPVEGRVARVAAPLVQSMSGFWGTAKEDAWHRRKAAEYAREEAIRSQGAHKLTEEKRSFDEQLKAKDAELARMREVVEECRGGSGASSSVANPTMPLMLALYDTLHGGVSFRPEVFAKWLCRTCPEEPAMAEELMLSWLEKSQCSEESMDFFFERYRHASDPAAYVGRVLVALPKIDSADGRGTHAFVPWAVREGKLELAFKAALALPKSRKRDAYGSSVSQDVVWEGTCASLAVNCMPLNEQQSIQRLGALLEACPYLSKALAGLGSEAALLKLLHFAAAKGQIPSLLGLREAAARDSYQRRQEGMLPSHAACTLAASAATDTGDAAMMAVIVDRLLASMQPAWIEAGLPLESRAFESAAIKKFVSANSACMRGKLTEYRTRATACLGAYPLANIEAEAEKRLQAFVTANVFTHDFTALCTTQHTKPESLAKCKRCTGASSSLWGWSGAALAAAELGFRVQPAQSLAAVRKWLEGRKCGYLFAENEAMLRQVFQHPG